MTVSTRTLIDIATEMAATAAGSSGDEEVAHSRADDLLIETIRWLAAGEPRTSTDLVDKIVADYNRVHKWYA